MPRKRKPARATRERRSRLAAATVILLAGGIIGYLALGHAPPSLIRPTACVAGPASDGLELNVGQAAIAATIAGVADRRDMPTRAVAIAYATALQESNLADLDYGDRDSVGVFQQRPSQGWGTDREIENPVYATTRFFAALVNVPRYLHIPIYQAAQAVQRSADGYAYAQYASAGTELAKAFTGALPHAVWCSYGTPVGRARLTAARKALTGVFGPLPGRLAGDPAVAVETTSNRQGWAVATWLVTNAANYGITDVQYQGYAWLADTGSGHWLAQRRTARTPAPAAAVVFG